MRAVDPDSGGLGERGNGTRALAQEFAMSDVNPVAAGEREPSPEFGMRSDRLSDRFRFSERRKSFEREKIG